MFDEDYEDEMPASKVEATMDPAFDFEYHEAMKCLNLSKAKLAMAMNDPATATSRLAALTSAQRQCAKEVERLDAIRVKEMAEADTEASTKAFEEAEAYIAARIDEVNLHHLADTNVYMAQIEGKWRLYPPSTVDTLFPGISTKMVNMLCKSLLKGTERSAYRLVYTMGATAKDELNALTYHVAEAVNAPYDPSFDLLVQALADRDPEKADYIERWLLARLNQIRAKSVTASYPALVIQNRDGGAGKDVLNQFVIPALVGKDAVLPNTSMTRMSSRFNAQFLGKLFISLNEAAMEATDYDSLKRLLGAPTFEAEIKNGPVVMADNIAAYVISGNEHYVVRLCASEVDRRFSIVKTDTKFRDVVAEALSVQGEVFANKAEFLARLDGLVRDVLGSTEEAAKWLFHLEQKHGPIMSVEPLHSTDYANSALTQLPAMERMVERVFNDDDVQAICDRQFSQALRKAMVEEGKRGGMRGDRLRQRLRETVKSYGFDWTVIRDKSNNPCDLYHRNGYDPKDYDPMIWQTVAMDGKFEPKIKL